MRLFGYGACVSETVHDMRGAMRVQGIFAVALAASVTFAPAALAQSTTGPGARDRAKIVMPEDPRARAFGEEYGFADAIVIDGTAYLSGVVAGVGEDGSLEGAYDRAFKRLGTILERAGASWGDVVDITSFHTDLTTQLSVMAKVKARYVRAPYPTWTAIGVSRLVPDRGLTEIKLVARVAPAASTKR